jgi:hypothetical protein
LSSGAIVEESGVEQLQYLSDYPCAVIQIESLFGILERQALQRASDGKGLSLAPMSWGKSSWIPYWL